MGGDGTKVHPHTPAALLKGEQRRLKSFAVSGKRLCLQLLPQPEALQVADRIFVVRRLLIDSNAPAEGRRAPCTLGPALEVLVIAPQAGGAVTLGGLADAASAALGLPREGLALSRQTGKGGSARGWSALKLRDADAKAKFPDFTVIGAKCGADDPEGRFDFCDLGEGEGGGQQQQRGGSNGEKHPKKSKPSRSDGAGFQGIKIKRYGDGAAARFS